MDIDILKEIAQKLLTPAQKKAAFQHLVKGKGFPERRVRHLIGLARSSARYQPTAARADEAQLT